MEFKYCPRCAHPLDIKYFGSRQELYCEKLKRCLASEDIPGWLESCLARD